MLTKPRRSLLPVVIPAGLAACLAMAADSPGDPVKRLREDWRQAVGRETRTLRDQYAASLLSLEKILAARGDYSGAERAKQERLKIQPSAPLPEMTAPTTPGAAVPGTPVALEPAAAVLAGGVVRDAAGGGLANWTGAGSIARWLLPPGLRAGGYEVELTWSCAPDAGGGFVLQEDRYSLKRPVTPTAGWDDYRTQIVGTLRVLANSRLLELSAAAVKGADLFHLKSIRLLPVDPDK